MENTNKVFEPRLPVPSGKGRRKAILIASVAVLLAAALIVGLVLLLIPRTPALTYHGVSVDDEMYAFWYSMLKTKLMTSYGLRGDAYDTEEVWNTVCPREGANGRTWGEVLDEKIHTAIKVKLVAAVMYDELGLTMGDNQKARVESYYDDMCEYVADGDTGELRTLLQAYKTTPAALRRCAVFDMKAELLCYYLASKTTEGMGSSENRGQYLTTEEIMKEYVENYHRVKIVYINNTVYGAYLNGSRVEQPLDFTGPGAQNDTDREELDGYLKNGGMTAEIFERYLAKSDEELHSAAAYPNGIYVTIDNSFGEGGFLEKDVAEVLYSVLPGRMTKVETSRGVRYLYGYELDTGAFSEAKNAAFFSDFFYNAAEQAVTDRATAELAEVEEHTENYAGLNLYTIPYNKEFKLCTIG